MAKVCLNMIVKNEGVIIERSLRSLVPAIDCYVICDTGSTDRTPELIRNFMDRHGIPGVIPTFTFHNFAQARNQALQAARESNLEFDYLLLADADMALVVEDLDFRNHLTDPMYTVRQESGLSYYNTRLIQRDLAAEYVGVTHEYVSANARQSRLETIHFIDHANGANRADKFERDIRLLSDDLIRDPNNPRSLFYLAQSYKDLGDHDRAIEFYRKRIDAGGWDQEVWYARYMVAICYLRKGDEANFVTASFEAYNGRPSRAEPLLQLAAHFRQKGLNDAAAAICELGMIIPPTSDTLFVEPDAYHAGFERELSIVSFYSASPSRVEAGREACFRQTISRSETPQWRWRSVNNATYYCRNAKTLFGSFVTKLMLIPTEPGFLCTNPSIVLNGDRRHCLIRAVNFRPAKPNYLILNDDDTYNTNNYIAELNESFDIVRHHPIDETADPGPIYPGEVHGFEDCRAFWFRDRPWLTATVRDRNLEQRNQIALLELDTNWALQRIHLQNSVEPEQTQKNWMPFVKDDAIHFIYRMDPMTVLRVDEATMQALPISRSTPPPALYLFRGGSQLLKIDAGWLTVIHETTEPSSEGRVYLHRFVLLDEHFAFVATTEPFYFLQRGIEFCAGLAYDQDRKRFVVSFGVNDNEAWLGFLDESAVYAQLRYTA